MHRSLLCRFHGIASPFKTLPRENKPRKKSPKQRVEQPNTRDTVKSLLVSQNWIFRIRERSHVFPVERVEKGIEIARGLASKV